MFDTDKTQERGQVGIGTLIVFIALVLVAAIAAGVLINTAGFLQSQAEATGEESTDQVANNLDVTLVSGTANTDTDTSGVQDIELTVQLAPGSDATDLTEVDIEVFPENEDRATVDGSEFDSDTLESGETSTLVFDDEVFGEAENLATGETGLIEGNSAEIVITTGDGSQVETVISAPDPITESDNGGDVRL